MSVVPYSITLFILRRKVCLPEDLQKMKEDPTYNINISGDLKQMIQVLKSDNAKELALHGGGGGKAQSERAAALAAILASKSETTVDSKNKTRSQPEPAQRFSVVDAASASVHGRSAAAVKAAPSEKITARIAMHMAGERTPVNVKLVRL